MSGQTFYHTLDGEPPHGGLPPQFNHYKPPSLSSFPNVAQVPTAASGPFFAPIPFQIPLPTFNSSPAQIQQQFEWLQNVFRIPVSAPAPAPVPAPAPAATPVPKPQRVLLIQPPRHEPKDEKPPKTICMQQPAGAPKSAPRPPPPQTSQIAIKKPVTAPTHRSPFPKGWIIVHRVSTISEVTAASGGWDTIPTDRFHWRAWAFPPTCSVNRMIEQLNYGKGKKVTSMHEIGYGGWVEGRTFGKNDQRTLKELGYEGAGWAMNGEEGRCGGGRRALWLYATKAGSD